MMASVVLEMCTTSGSLLLTSIGVFVVIYVGKRSTFMVWDSLGLSTIAPGRAGFFGVGSDHHRQGAVLITCPLYGQGGFAFGLGDQGQV